MKQLIIALFTLLAANAATAQWDTSMNMPGVRRGDSMMRYVAMGDTARLRGDTACWKHNKIRKYSVLPRWVVDVNLMGGMLMQNLDVPVTTTNYPSAVISNISTPEFINGYTFGADAQLGFFFGPKRHFGIGTGVLYFYQMGDLDLDKFRVEYRATDKFGDVYRQIVSTTGNAKEKITVSNFNIPLLLKYKTKFSRRWGFTADAGLLFNLQATNTYKTNAAFNYEAIYKYVTTETGTTAVYDNSPIPDPTSVLYTQAHVSENHTPAEVEAYFNNLRNMGYNVGLNVKPNTDNGTVSYNTGSIGFLVRPAMSLYLSDRVALNFGVFYAYQNFNRDNSSSYRFTDRVGDYSSAMNSVKSSQNHSFGLNAGVRFLFGAPKDRDKDGIPDRLDKCPDQKGHAKFEGCPDTDGDGIQDKEDSCVNEAGPCRFYGCPDTDNDGIPDKYDQCPTEPGPIEFHGCPDRDHDGIPDREDRCPDAAGPKEFRGCPDTDGDKTPDIDDRCPEVPGPADNQGCPPDTMGHEMTIDISTPLLFDFNRTTIKESSYPVLDKAYDTLLNDKSATLRVVGHADAIGSRQYNKGLSYRRAQSVKNYFIRKGLSKADLRRIRLEGHGEDDPADSNDTEEGRARNRRAVMELKEGKK